MKRFSLLLFCAACLAAKCAHASDTSADFLKIIERPRVALAPQIEGLPMTNDIAQFHFSFASDASDRVPGILLESTNFSGRRPVVIVMHGTGGRKENELPLLRRLARAGFVAVAIDGRYHGERASGRQRFGILSKSHRARVGRAAANIHFSTTRFGTSCGCWIICKRATTLTRGAAD